MLTYGTRAPDVSSTLRISGWMPCSILRRSMAQTGTSRLGPPSGGAHETSVTDMPCRGSKKHIGRRPGLGSPFATASAQARRYWPSAMFRLTACMSAGRRAASRAAVPRS